MDSSRSAAPTAPASSIRPRTRCTWSAEERAEWIRLLEASGQTLSEFCRDSDLPESTVSLWRRQLRGAAAGPGDDGAFLEVSLPAGGRSGAAAAVVIELGDATRLVVAAGTEVAWVAELVRALRTA